jgi:hypothetical protein
MKVTVSNRSFSVQIDKEELHILVNLVALLLGLLSRQ